MATVADVMSQRPVTVRSDASLKDAISLMVEKRVGTLYVVDADNVPLGVFTERDLLRDVVSSERISREIEIGEMMSRNVISIPPETSVQEAARIMISKKGRLAVTKGGAVVGVVTTSDLVRAFSEGPENRSMAGLVTQKVKTLDAGRTVFDAVEMMHEKGIGSVAVTRDGTPFGIFTERDLLRILASGPEKRIIDIRLEEVASKPLITASLGITAREAAFVMKSNKIKRLPLLKGENLAGIVTARDLVETYVSTGLPVGIAAR